MKVPFSKALTNQKDIKDLKKDFEFPLMVKGKFYDAYLAYNEEQVRMHYNKITAKWGLPVIIQEFIRGTEVNVVALGDGKGNTIGAVPMRKQYITDKGKAWAGITLDDKKLLALTDKIISATKWRGGMELEIVKSKDNEMYVIEINPRIPAWVYLAVGAGQNLPEAMVKLALRMNVEPFTKYDVGKMFISPDILSKAGQLDEEEWQIMQQHPRLGAEYLLNTPGVPRLAVVTAFEHHMRYDNAGYPQTAQPWQQHICSYMTAISDTYDAMRTHRAYEKSLKTDQIISIMLDLAGNKLHPQLTYSFLQVLSKLDKNSEPSNYAAS